MYTQSAYHDAFYAGLLEEPATALNEMSGYFRPSGRLLDFGCGSGSFLVVAKKAGFDADGVELDEAARLRAAGESGCPVLSLDELLSRGKRYDVIHLGDVLEHLPDPRGTMLKLEQVLAPGGRFFIEGPLEDNASLVFYASRLFGWAKKMARPNNVGRFPPFHLARLTAASQRTFFERLGYEILYYRVHETGWPYADVPGSSLGARLRRGIGRASIGAASLGTNVGFSLGNRFTAVLTRPTSVEGDVR